MNKINNEEKTSNKLNDAYKEEVPGKKIEKSEKTTEEKIDNAKKNGLYAALGVCLVSIAAAAIVTYMGYTEFSKSNSTYKAGSEAVYSSMYENDDPLVKAEREEIKQDADEGVNKSTEKSDGELLTEHEGDEAAESESVSSPMPEKTTVSYLEPADDTEENSGVEVANYEISPQFSRVVEGYDVINGYSGDLVYNEVMKDYRTHNGIDIFANEGEKVYSAANGMIKGIYSDHLLGDIIEIEHGEYIFYYCGLNITEELKPGDIVTAGKVIAAVGSTPFESNLKSHIHLEVKKNGMYIDPAQLIS